MIVEYIGLAEKVSDGYSVFFHDFPGCGSAGKTLEKARKNAREGLLNHIELMIEDGELIPKPSSIDNIVKLRESKGCILLIIPIVMPSGKAKRINITIDSSLLHAIDAAAADQHKTRSALLAEAAQNMLSDL